MDFVGNFDHKVAVLENDTTYYIQCEFTVPKGAPADMTYQHLQALAAAFERGLHR